MSHYYHNITGIFRGNEQVFDYDMVHLTKESCQVNGKIVILVYQTLQTRLKWMKQETSSSLMDQAPLLSI